MIEEELNKAGMLLVKTLVNNLIADDSVATGNLIRSVRYDIIERAEKFSLNIIAADYLSDVDEGRDPGEPPDTDDIIAWAKAKGIDPYRGQSYESMGYNIARSIGEEGIVGTDVIQRSIDSTINNIRNIIAKGAREEVIDLINKAFQ
jgi:hypothetical protein